MDVKAFAQGDFLEMDETVVPGKRLAHVLYLGGRIDQIPEVIQAGDVDIGDQGVRTDKDSGIVNDSNDWATETMQNPKYPLELLLRVIALSVETLRLVGELPKLDVLES